MSRHPASQKRNSVVCAQWKNTAAFKINPAVRLRNVVSGQLSVLDLNAFTTSGVELRIKNTLTGFVTAFSRFTVHLMDVSTSSMFDVDS